MKRNLFFALSIATLSSAVSPSNLGAGDWLSFRGSNTLSATDDATLLPESDASIVAWEVPTGGNGISSPIVVPISGADGGSKDSGSSQVIVTSTGGQDQRDITIESFDAADGTRLWSQSLMSLGRPFTHPTSANASPSPASDGNSIVALFSSCDLVCLNNDGSPAWFRALAVDHPRTGNDISMSSSPAIIDGVVAVQLENQGDSFVTGIDLKTGVTLWEMPRPARSGWASPIGVTVATDDGQMVRAVAFQNGDGVAIHDLQSGKILRELEISGSTTSSPTFADPLLLVPGDGLVAFDLSKPDAPVAWENSRLSCRNASPVVRGDTVYVSKGSVLMAATLADGEVLWQERMPDIGSVWATPIASASGVYVFDQSGNVSVAVPGQEDEPVVMGPAELTGPILATPAVHDGAIYVRANRMLIKVAKP